MRILIVEDDYVIARSTERLVRRATTQDVEVVHVITAEGAISELRTGELGYALVISDYNLAGHGTGADVLAQVRSMRTQPRFLFLSSDDAIEQLGVPYLTKPCRPSELRNAVSRLIEPAKTVREMPLDGAFDVGGEA